ncbi:MAG: tetratricopeptide repeat protein [Candidatus Eremiobacteraeota bacterium]|nr:tetratricopeptide repeat protein [Candidatus Eremiobacteraeota bacterium]
MHLRKKYIPLLFRWSAFLSMFLIFSLIMAFPLAEQNFLRADGLMALGLMDQAAEHYNRALLLAPRFDQAYSMLAWIYELRHDDKRAAAVYEKGIARHSGDEMIFLHYIVFLWKMGDNDKALEVCRHAYADFPEVSTVQRVYANALEKAGRDREAIEIWKKFAEDHPGDPSVREKLRKREGKGGL